MMRTKYQDENDNWISVPIPIKLDIVIRNAILNALAYHNGNQYLAGVSLGLSDRVINYKMKIYGIPRSRLS